jgi:hypothetical protein
MGKRYEMQRLWNEDRSRFSGLDINVKFDIMAQSLFDISETLALIYDKLNEIGAGRAEEVYDCGDLPI